MRTWARFHSALPSFVRVREAEGRSERARPRLPIVEARVKEITFVFTFVRSGIFARKEVAAQRIREAIQLPLPPEFFSWINSILADPAPIRDVLLLIWAHFQRKEHYYSIFDRLQKWGEGIQSKPRWDYLASATRRCAQAHTTGRPTSDRPSESRRESS